MRSRCSAVLCGNVADYDKALVEATDAVCIFRASDARENRARFLFSADARFSSIAAVEAYLLREEARR